MDEEQKDLIQAPEAEKPARDQRKFLVIRIIVAAYIAYLGGDLLKSYLKGTAGVGILIAAIVFLLAGIGVVLWSLWKMVKDK